MAKTERSMKQAAGNGAAMYRFVSAEGQQRRKIVWTEDALAARRALVEKARRYAAERSESPH